MTAFRWIALGTLLLTLNALPSRADDEAPAPKDEGAISFLDDVAPILVRNCVGCHNPKKAEGKYDMATFAALARGGEIGEGFTLEPGKPEESYLVELIQPDAEPRMPYKLDPLPADEIALIERWVAEGAAFDGDDASTDWVALVSRRAPATAPESYPVAVPITALAFSPDGSAVAASGYHELTLWNVADGALAARIAGLAERTYDIAYSADGNWMATAGGDPGQYGAAMLWKANPDGTAEPARTLVETDDSVFAVAFSPDSTIVAAAGADRAIRLFQVESGEPIATIEDHADWIFDLAFSPDGTRLASASRDKTSKVFDVATAEALVTFPGHANTVFAVRFAPEGGLVATAGADKRLRIWNPDADGKQVRDIGGFGGEVFQVLYPPGGNGTALIGCGADALVRIFDPSDGSLTRNLEGHGDWVYSLAISADGTLLASGSWDGQVRLWNLEADGAPVSTILAAPGFSARQTADAGEGQ